MIIVHRVYDHPVPPGTAFLVDGLWPRGIAKADLPHVTWVKEVAPSAALRRWFGHDPARWDEFRRRYAAELDANRAALAPIAEAAGSGTVVLLFGTRETGHNNAVALREYLERHARHGKAHATGAKA